MSFSDKNSSMYDASESAAQLADFLKIKQDRGVVESQIYRDREKRANDLQDKAKEANDKANEGGLTISIPATEWFDETAEGKEQMRILDDKLFNLIPNSAGLTTEQKTEKLKQLSISGTEAQKREIRVIEIVYNKNKVSGYNEITELKGAAVAGGVRKRFADEDVKTKIKQSNVVFNFSKEDGMYGYNKKYMKNIEMGMTLAEMNKSLAGNRQLNKDSKKSSQFIPTTIEYIEESATPMFTLNNKKETGLGANAGYRMIQEEVRDPNTQEILRPRLEKTISGIISNHIVEIDVNNYSPIEGVKKSNQF